MEGLNYKPPFPDCSSLWQNSRCFAARFFLVVALNWLVIWHLMDMTPEQTIHSWFEQISQDLAEFLATSYVFMYSPTSDKFAMSNEEALQWFLSHLQEHDFPLRRVARILSVRAIINFLLYQPSTELDWLKDSCRIIYIQSVLFRQARLEWDRLVENELSDESLTAWLRQLQKR